MPPKTTMEQQIREKLNKALKKYKVSMYNSEDLMVLRSWDIVVIVDDSRSMLNKVEAGTRWTELKKTLNQILEIACCLVPAGIDIYFLNDDKIPGVTDTEDARLVHKFNRAPEGGTPMAATLQQVLKAKAGSDLLVLVATDGLPDEGTRRVAKIIEQSIKTGKVRYQLLPCSDQAEDTLWMEDLDLKFKEVDCTDDYNSERSDVLRAGLVTQFEKSDYLMKALLGPLIKRYDAMDWDAKKLSRFKKRRNTGSACNLDTGMTVIIFIVIIGIIVYAAMAPGY